MLTEEQAREKWCPMARQLGSLIGRRDATEDDRTIAMGSQNRGYQMGGPLDNCMCLASKCAMWRWSDAKRTKAYLDAVQAEMQATKIDFNKATQVVWARNGRHFEHTEGYCGLGGKPE